LPFEIFESRREAILRFNELRAQEILRFNELRSHEIEATGFAPGGLCWGLLIGKGDDEHNN